MTARGAGPIYQRIADDLRARIEDGQLGPGAKLPTEQELTSEHGVTRATVRQATQVLINEGLVVSERPRGHYVRRIERLTYRPQSEWRVRPAHPELPPFVDEPGEQDDPGREPSETLAVELAEPPTGVAARLAIPHGTTVVVRRRVRHLDGVPIATHDSYFPLELVAGSELMHPTDTGRAISAVLTELGAEQTHAVDEIEIRMPTPAEAGRLEVGLGVPVALHRVTGYTEEDRPVRVECHVLPGDRHLIVFERARRRRRPASGRR